MSVALVARVFDTQANESFDVTFERFPVRIGRNQLNDLHIDRPYVSQFHARSTCRTGRSGPGSRLDERHRVPRANACSATRRST